MHSTVIPADAPKISRRPSGLVWICAAILSAGILGFSVLFMSNLREEALTTAERDLTRYSLTVSEQADRSFKSVDLVMLNIEEHIARAFNERSKRPVTIDTFSGVNTNTLLKEKLAGLPQLDSLVIVDAKGNVVNSSRDWPLTKVTVADRDYFVAMMNDPNRKTYVSAPLQNRATGKWTIFLVRRLSGAKGEFAGVLLGGMTLQYFEDLYAGTSLGSASATSLMRNDGTMLARYPREEIGKVFPNGPRMLGAARAATIRETSPIDGTMRIKAAHRLANFPVYVLTTRTEESVLRAWRGTATLFMGLALGLSLLLLVAAGLIVRWWHQQQQSAQMSAGKALAEKARAEAEASLFRERERAAEAASSIKSAFLASMSHEIRTPMNGVLGMADILGRTELTAQQQRLVATINQSATTLLTIINDILDFSRIEADKLELDPRSFDLRQSAESVIELLANDAQRKGLELSLLLPSSVPAYMVGDAGRLRQILTNLVGNAIKFTSAGEVALRITQLDDVDDKHVIQFSVSDTGIGIDATAQALLFKPFAQADSTISRRFGGTGLGLSIAQQLVRMMGGEIALNSELGKGTTVSFNVMLGKSSDVQTATPAVSINEQRVLVVDDRATNREIICSYLTDMGAMPQAASTAEEALLMLRQSVADNRPFALALLDMVLPGINGLELAERIRSEPSTAGVRMIMVTSLSWKADSLSARDAGIGEFLSKPIRRNDLLAAVQRSLSATPQAAVSMPATTRTRTATLGVFKGLNVLIAEDNPVNQEVASEYAHQLDCETHIAENGLIAVEAFSAGRYDIVLMDCQMPEMDGLTACRKIRELEAARGLSRTPIIAVTANAYESDRAKCLAAGMDDFMSKPFTVAQLADVLGTFVKKPSGTAAADGNAHASAASPNPDASDKVATLDPAPLTEFEKQQPGMAARLVELFLATAPKAVRQIMMAVVDADHEKIRTAAHGLKSSSATIGAFELTRIATKLEAQALAGEPIRDCLLQAALLEAELGAVRRVLETADWRTQDQKAG